MFAPIYNTDFLLDAEGNPIKSNKLSNFEFPPNMPKLKYISDINHKICLDINNNLCSFDNNRLILLKSNVEHIIIKSVIYVLTFNGDLFTFSNGEFKLLLSNISWISTFPYGIYFKFCFACSNSGEALILISNNCSILPEITFPLLEDIKFIRESCIITTNNDVLVYFFDIDINKFRLERFVSPIYVIDAYFTVNDFECILFILSEDNKVYYKSFKCDGTVSDFIKINDLILGDIGVVQFITLIKNNIRSDTIAQSNKGYTFVIEEHRPRTCDIQFPNNYVIPLCNIPKRKILKSARSIH